LKRSWLDEKYLIPKRVYNAGEERMKMRTIKFRAWDKENKQMITSSQGVSTIIRRHILDYPGLGLGTGEGNSEVKKGKFEIMQFTGSFDKNGKEIYEGDIIENENKEKLLIVWVEDICAFYQSMIPWSRITTTQVKNLIPHMVDMRFNHKEVIGNIYENPELLQTIS